MATPALDAVTEFIVGAPSLRLPGAVTEAAKQALMDWFAVSAAAFHHPGPRSVAELMQRWKSQGNALTLYGKRGAAGPVALVNGTLAHMLDYDDVHLGTASHIGASVIAAALAVGMDRGATEAEILKAIVVGYETGATLGGGGLGVRLADKAWHPTSILGTFAAAAATACLLGLDDEKTRHSIGTAATQAAGLIAAGGSVAKPFHVGKAAMNGIMAAEGAELGLTSKAGLIDDPRTGLFAVLLQEGVTPAVTDLGKTWQIVTNSYKPYPACQFAHAPFEAAQKLRARAGAKTPAGFRVFVHPLGIKVAGNLQPKSPIEAKFSIAYGVGLGYAGAAMLESDFTAANLANPEVDRVRANVELAPDPTLARWSARVEMTHADGTSDSESIPGALGSPENPMQWADLERKFTLNAEPVYGARTKDMLGCLRSFEVPGRLASLRALIETV